MKCPHCNSEEDRVVDSRAAQDGRAVRRRRECLNCNERFTTYEYVENAPLAIIKGDNRREPYDRRKLLTGITLACKKRPVSVEQIESMVNAIEADLGKNPRSEIESKLVGEMVMERLRKIDEVAYVRFASVYRHFQDKEEFLEEIRKLLSK